MRCSDQTELLRSRQLAAFHALQALEPFEGRLTGPLAAGALQQHDPVVLHVSAEHPDLVAAHLSALGIPIRHLSARLHIPRGPGRAVDGYGFVAGGIEFELWVLSESDYRQRLRVASESPDLPRLSATALQRRLLAEAGMDAMPASTSMPAVRATIVPLAALRSVDQVPERK